MTDSASAVPNRFGLTGKDKRHLRSLGNQMRPAVMIGQEGLTDAVFRAIDQAHRGNELIKLKILEPGDVVEVDISGVGRLVNPVVAEHDTAEEEGL